MEASALLAIPDPRDPCHLLPPPGELRLRLSRSLREAKLLRGLLRLAEQTVTSGGVPAADADPDACRAGVDDV